MTGAGTGKRLLLLSVSAGNGHVRAAEGLAAGAGHWFPDCVTNHVDLMTLVPAIFRKTYKDAYLGLVQKHPSLWGLVYEKTDKSGGHSAFSGLRRAIESASNRPLLDVIRDFRPDHIICTHFMPLQVLARWRAKGRITSPVWAVITDFKAHRYWLEPGQAGYFTATEEDAWAIRRRGMRDECIEPFGIPVMPGFIPPKDPVAARKAAAAKFGLDPAKTTFLLMGGGAGVGAMRETARELLNMDGNAPGGCRNDFQLVVLAGRNQSLLKALAQEAASFPRRLFPLGFTSDVHVLLAASDLVISKPGGLTTVESLSMGRPMLAFAPIPGQEEHNADFLLENGAALKAVDQASLLWRVRRVLHEPELLPRLSACAAKLGKPYAARDILERILGEKAAG